MIRSESSLLPRLKSGGKALDDGGMGWGALVPSATIAALALALFSCARKVSVEAPELFPIAVPDHADAYYEREYVGEVQAIQRAEIRARIKGRIDSVAIDEGQAVKAGQLLFAISAKEWQQEVRSARAAAASAAAELKAAEIDRANAKMLLDKAIVSSAEVALIEAKLQSVSAKLEEAKAHEEHAAVNLTYADVRAPFAGVVNRIHRKAGSLISEGDLLTTLTNPSEMFVYFRVSEQEYLQYTSAAHGAPLKEVSFKLANGEILPGVGKMDAVETEFDPSTGTIAFRARFSNESRILKHGSSGKVLIKTHVENAVTVPQKSTFEVQDHVYLYVVDSEGRARARRIMPKIRLKDTFVVQSGIGAGERFILEGVQRVKDGARIGVQNEPSRVGAHL